MAGLGGMQEAVQKTMIEAAKVLESELDAEIGKLENMDSDELDKLRYVLSILEQDI